MTALSQTKIDLIRSSDNPELAEKEYSQFMINRAFSYFPDTILHAQEMNKYAGQDNIFNHDYYLHSLRPKKRFSKWFKPEKIADVEAISRAYNINIQRAKEYYKLLSAEDMNEIRALLDTGGLNGKQK